MAIVTGILHLGLSPVLVVNDVRPNLTLVAVVLVTAFLGFEHGMIWAFAGGVTVSLLGFEPLGAPALALLAACALVAGGGRLFGRVTWVFPVAAAFAASLLYDATVLALFALTGRGLELPDPAGLMLPAAVFNGVLAALLVIPMRLFARRVLREEAPPWA